MTCTVRPARHHDHPAIGSVIASAFGGEGAAVAALWSDVRAGGLVLAELVAVERGSDGASGDEVVGHVGVSHAWLDARRELVDIAVLSPLSTRPDRQGRGIGTAMVAAALSAARASGRPMLVLEGSPSYYGRRGFERAALHGVEAASVRTPEPAQQVALLEGHEAWMTGRVVYPDVWWRHDAAGLRDPDLAALEQVLGESFPPVH